MLKQLLRRITPASWRAGWNRFRLGVALLPGFRYDFKRYRRFSYNVRDEEGCIARIAMRCHGIEKGLTMPNFRYGFGRRRMVELVGLVDDFIAAFGADNPQLAATLEVIGEYRECHQRGNRWEAVDPALRTQIDTLLARFPAIRPREIQIPMTRERFFAAGVDAFPNFARSRHSLRNFSDEPIPLDDLRAAIRLALSAPSGCNRQPARTILVRDPETIVRVLALQSGNCGFTDRVNKLIVVAGYLGGYNGVHERNWVYVDTGIFTMNLVYALHYYRIGACILNWHMLPRKDAELRRILKLDPGYSVAVMIACGMAPAEFRVCTSARKDLAQIHREL